MSPLPQQFGRYTLHRKIGEGGMAEVYAATVAVAEGLAKRVVVKKIRRDCADQPEYARMFVDEAKIALGLNHANIVQVFDFGQVHGDLYLAMELVEGVDLMRLFHTVTGRGERIPPVVAAYIAHQAAAGLAYAHHKSDDHGAPIGIVHRDISPHNIMIAFAGTVKILDFGIARPAQASGALPTHRLLHGSDVLEDMTIQGKVAYMAPEQAMGRRVDPRADIYALGVVLYEMLSGELVYRGRSPTALLEEVRSVPLPPLRGLAPELPEPLLALVDRALARDPADRWESARALQGALASFLHRADPVVDDEVLSAFVTRYHPPSSPPADELRVADADATRELSEPQRRAPVARRETHEVVLLRAHLRGGEPAPDPQRFLKLAGAIAFKRDALQLRLDAGGIALAFGVIEITQSPASQAIRVAQALREAIGDAAPGLGIGVAVAALQLPVHRVAGAPVVVEVAPAIDAALDALAASALDGPVMVAGGLIDALAERWRLGEARPTPREGSATLTGLDRVAPLLGPLDALDRRIHHVPGARAVLYGRELELRALRESFAEAIRARRTRAVLLTGAPGLGKRTLLERFIGGLPRGSAALLRVSGQWRRRNVALGALLDLFQRFLGLSAASTRAEVEARLRGHGIDPAPELAAALARALELPGERPSRDPTAQREALARLFRRLLSALADERPILAVVEAVHFVDEESLELLASWLERQATLPALVVMTSRPSPRLDRLRELPGLVELDLRELDAQARHELIVRRFQDPAEAEELAQAILARTAGNPLYIEETLALLLRQGVIGWDAQGRFLTVRQRGAKIEVPPSVEAALTARLDALDQGEREAVEAAAVLGQSFRPPEIDRLVDAPRTQLLDRLVAIGIFEADPSQAGALRFTSVSLHEICKQAIASGAIEALHARAVEIKRSRPDYRPGRDDGPIAEHLVQAGRPEEAIAPALRAAAAARALGASGEAYYLLSLALRALPEGDPRRFDVLGEREPILRAWGRRRLQGADIRQMLDLAEGPAQEVEASLRLLRFYAECGRSHHADQLLPRLEARIAELSDPVWASARLGEVRADLLLARGALREAAEAATLTLALEPLDPRQRALLLLRLGQAQLRAGDLEDAGVTAAAALALAAELADKRLQGDALTLTGEIAGRSTRYQQAIDAFLEALEIDRDLGDRIATGTKLANLGITYTAIGLYRRAERYLRKALELHEALGNTGLLGDVVVHLGEVMAELGDYAAARSLLGDAAAIASARGDLRTELRAHARLAGVLVDEAGPEEAGLDAAEALAAQVLDRARAQGLRTASVRALQILSRVAERRGALTEAIALEREAVDLHAAGAAPVDGILSIHHLGLLLDASGDLAGSQEALRRAAELTQARLDDLRSPELRRSYLAQPKVQALLAGRALDHGVG